MSEQQTPDANAEAGDDAAVVCVAHMRFVPCRGCDDINPAAWSSDPADVERVREHQQGIKLEACVERGVYRLDSRNLTVGVCDGNEGFVGIREKFGSRYLFTEYHWDQGSPYGTVRPRELLGMLPDDIAVREANATECGACAQLVRFDRNDGEATGVWSHIGDGDCGNIRPTSKIYLPLFEYLTGVEAALAR